MAIVRVPSAVVRHLQGLRNRHETPCRELFLHDNQLSGGLEPLRGCTALLTLHLDNNQLTGGLEPIRGCKVLQELLGNNKLTGGLEPLRGSTELQHCHLHTLDLKNNQLNCTDEDTEYFEWLCYISFEI